MKKKGLRTLTKRFRLGTCRKTEWVEDLRVRKRFRAREKVFY